MFNSISRYSIRYIWKGGAIKSQYLSVLLSLSRSSIELNKKLKNMIDSQQYIQALNLFDHQQSISTNVRYTLALKACSQLNDYERSILIHKQLSLKSLKDPFIQTSLIHCYSYISNNMPEKVLELFEKNSIDIDEVIITMLFNACAKLCAIQIGNDTLKKLPFSFLNHQKLVNSAIDMLMKFGDVNQAQVIFRKFKIKLLLLMELSYE
ncbi:unnamed protein product [Rotaria sp. Silwood2]|nr:unnamed protein product [Rotaria sp. Silwood2]CAF4220730.1 unnamed protein product [Rotaria sp. Silwood2]